jgi:hypothetical protein
MRERIEEIVTRLRPQLVLILGDPELGPTAAKIYLAFICLLEAGRTVGCPRQKGNLKRIRAFVIEHWDLLDAAIATIEPAPARQDQEVDHATP